MSLAFRFRFNWQAGYSNNIILMESPSFYLFSGNTDVLHKNLIFYHNWSVTGSPTAFSSTYGDVVTHVVSVYDKDDASKQAMYVNGRKIPVNVPATAAFGASQPTYFSIGTNQPIDTGVLDVDFEDVLLLSGYSLSQAEAIELMDGADPTTFGAGAAQRGYWSFKGTPGATVSASDPGLTNSFAPSFASSLMFGADPGSSLVYGADMPYVSPVGPGDVRVYTCGTAVRVGLELQADGRTPKQPIKAVADSISTFPTIKIDGGSPITLERPLYSADYAGVLLFLPSGQSVPKDANVTFSAPEGWLETAVGGIGAATDMAIPNRSGKAVYGDLPPTMRVGQGYAQASEEWGYEHGRKNLALRAQVDNTFTLRADGTLMDEVDRIFLIGAGKNFLDETGSPIMLGKYALAFDDNDPADPTDVTISSVADYYRAGITELTEYRNDGDASGVGKARVYDVQTPHWTVAIVGDVDASTTTLTLASMNDVADPSPSGYNTPIQYLKIDSEYCRITARNVGAGQVTVDRGCYGSTAAPHTGGTVANLEPIQPYPSLALSFRNPTTHQPNYKNLVVFGPNDFTLPDPPAPIVLDRSEESLLDTSWYVKESLKNGSGVIRQLQGTQGGYAMWSEVEHLRKDDDPFPNLWLTGSTTARLLSSEQATAAAAPYVYNNCFFPGGEKYTVTLAADVTTAPAAGTQEVIQITNDPANPLMYSIRVELPGGEVVRVLSVSGDSVTVERGVEGTTPTTHAAGTCQARWRFPTTDAMFQTTGEGRTLYTTDVAHQFWSRMLIEFPKSNDLNPLARINVTLTANVSIAPADPANDTLSVSVDPADAQYLASGLIIGFDSECVRVKSATIDGSGNGTILVERKYCSASAGRSVSGGTLAAHASGTVGTGSSGGVFMRAADSSGYSWSPQAAWRLPILVTGPNKFVISQIGVASTGVAWVQDAAQAISPAVDDRTAWVGFEWPGACYSYEHAARIAKLAPGADHWVNMPEHASDDCVDHIARVTRDGLPAGQHRVIIELGNEFWNFTILRLKGVQEMGAVCGFADLDYDLVIYRSCAVAQRVKAVFDEQGRGSEVKLALAWQQGSVTPLIQRAVALGLDADIDVVSTAPYFLPDSSTVLDAAYEAATDEEALAIWLFDLEYNLANITGSSLDTDGRYRRYYEETSGRSIEFIEYEGGPDSYVPVPTANTTNGMQRQFDLNYHPNNYFAAYDFPLAVRRRGGVDGIAVFDHISAPFNSTYSNSVSQWGANEFYGQPYGYGDGSDGKADNRLIQATPGRPHTKHPTVNMAGNVVSVRQQALLDYNAAYAGMPSPPPQPSPVPFVGRAAAPRWRRF
jgi:hypothetical protein